MTDGPDEVVNRDLARAEERDSWTQFAAQERDNAERLVEAGCTQGEAYIILILNELLDAVRSLPQ